ncbi:MAG TPA: signal peptidase I [Microthrixaceae bacterium]|nr:signal peptidase I [Microthrixaceae bacterium]
MTRTRRPRLLRSLATLLMFAALVVGLWPARFGGAASFVVVRGHSMEPSYELGDLLYVRSASEYRVGDIAVYRIPEGEPGEGHLVVHRIIRILDGGRYQFQGDNREFPDDSRPQREDLVGRPLINLGTGATRGLVVLPFILSAVLGIAIAMMLWPASRPLTETDDAEPGDESGPRDDAGPLPQRVPALARVVMPAVGDRMDAEPAAPSIEDVPADMMSAPAGAVDAHR